jgi:general secretion pathway protein J
VDEIQIRFLDEQNDWRAIWPPPVVDQAPTDLPRAMELSVTLSDWGEITRLFRLPAL